MNSDSYYQYTLKCYYYVLRVLIINSFLSYAAQDSIMNQEASGISYFNPVNQFGMNELKFWRAVWDVSKCSISGILPEFIGDFDERLSVLLNSEILRDPKGLNAPLRLFDYATLGFLVWFKNSLLSESYELSFETSSSSRFIRKIELCEHD